MSSDSNVKLNGKVAIITGTSWFKRYRQILYDFSTGASSGIGLCTALKFASRGYKLSLCAKDGPTDEEGISETVKQCLQTNYALNPLSDVSNIT